ncbi:MAG: GAF domain-containing protein [Acidobacteria bacterium]|nr:GAF domain-containing protein [Acidobacteriota bacterium]
MPDIADFMALFEHTSDPALVVDEPAGRVLASNLAFAALAAWPSASLAGTELNSLFVLDGEGETGERATLCVGGGEGRVSVRLEKYPCRWDGESACLYLVRESRAAGEEGPAEREADRLNALLDYLHEASEQLEVVNRIVAAVNASRTIEEVFSLASEQMRSLLSFDRASIALCEEDGEHLRVFALSGEKAGSLSLGAVGRMRGSVTETALNERRMIVIPELLAETRFNAYRDLEREGFRSAVCVPLFSTHRAVGSLNLTSRSPEAYRRKHLLALERLAPPLALAIEKVLLLEEAERRSREMEAAARREELSGRIGRHLASSLDASSVLQETVETLGHAFEVERCHITLFGGEDGRDAAVHYEYRARADVLSLRDESCAPLRTGRHARHVLESEESVPLCNVAEAERDELIELYERLRVQSVLAAPVHDGGQHVGLLELHDCYRARVWTQEEQKLLCMVAAQVSVALTNAQLFEASRDRNEELRGLFEISRTFSTLTDTSEISGRLARSIAKLVGGTMCLIATYDRRHHTVRAEAPGYHTPPELIREFRFTLDKEQALAPVYLTGESFLSNDPAHDTRLNRNFVKRWGITSALSVPMKLKQELIGFIYVANRAGGFSDRGLRLLEIFAAQAAETIVNARLFQTIQAQAEREAVVNRLLLSLQRSGEPREKVQSVIERIGEVLELDRCVAVLFADGEHEDYCGEWCADGVEAVSERLDVRERSPIRYALSTTRRPIYAADVRRHPLAAGNEDLIEQTQLQSLLVVPIMHLGRVIGSISAHQTRRQRNWAEDDIDLMMAVATHVGATLENARLITELREANRLKDEFLAMLSHELRTPLTAITGWVDILGESEALALDSDLADGVEVIRASATSLTQLITDLLDLSRIQRGVLRLERQSFDINQIVTNAARNVRQAAIARRLDVRMELAENLPPTIADPQRIQQVLWNLLSNAIKFTPEGGYVTAQTRLRDRGVANDAESSAVRRAQWIEIEVADTGEGIAPEFLPFIWDRFRQADSSATRRHGGLGIGLSLVKELVEAHGGQVEAFSDGHGARFTVRLPVIEVEEWLENEPSFESPRRAGDAEAGEFN